MVSILSYLKIIRPVNGLMGAIAVYIAGLVSGVISVSSLIPTMELWLAMIVVFLVNSGGMIVNDIFDIEIDKINKPKRPLPSGKISINTAKYYAAILFGVGVVLSVFINIYALGVAILAVLLLYFYAARLKKLLFVGNVVVSILVGLTFVYGGLINLNLLAVSILASMGFLANLGREIYKTCEDVLGDKHARANTVAIKYGVIRAKSLGSFFTILAILVSPIPYILGIFGLSYLALVIIADLIYIAAIISPVKKSATYVKIAMNIGLLAFLVGVFI